MPNAIMTELGGGARSLDRAAAAVRGFQWIEVRLPMQRVDHVA